MQTKKTGEYSPYIKGLKEGKLLSSGDNGYTIIAM